MTMHEHCHIALRERRLMVGDRIERDARFRNDAFAVALRDRAMIFDPFDFETALPHARCGGTDLILRFEGDALRFQTAVIDARIDVEFGKPPIDLIRPPLTPLLDTFGSVPVSQIGRATFKERGCPY